MISFINTCKWSITQESARQLNEYFSLSEQKKHLAADKLEHLSLTLSKSLVTEKALLIAKLCDRYTLRRHFEKGISQSKCQENQCIIKLQSNYASGDDVVRFYWKNQTKNTVVPKCVSQQYVS